MLRPPARADASVTLVGGWTASGRVVRGGAPVETAQVGAAEISSDGRERGPVGFTLSGSDGAFTLGPLPESVARVRLDAFAGPTMQPGDTRPLVEVDRGAPGVVLDLAGRAITGRVVAAGAPARDVEVRAVPLDGTRGGASARTSPDGSFTIAGCRPSTRYSVDARPAGIPAASIAVTTPATGSVDAGTLEIRTDELSGTARTASGESIRELKLYLARPDGARLGPLTVEIDPGGTWHVRAPAAEPMAFRAWAPPHAPALGVTAPGEPLALTLPRPAHLEIVVQRGDGRPLSAARVRLVSWNGRVADEHLVPSMLPGVQGTRGDMTDDLGRLLASPLAAGAYVLEIWRDDCQPARVSFTLEEGERESLSVTLEPR